MTEHIWDPLVAEEARLKRELLENATFRRLEAVRESIRSLKRAYGQYTPDSAEVRISAETFNSVKRRRSESVTGRVVQLAEDSMRSSGRRVTSGQVLALANAAGVPITGDKPQSLISSILSHAPQFNNNSDSHGAGYGLAEWRDEPDGDDLYADEAPSAEAEEAPF